MLGQRSQGQAHSRDVAARRVYAAAEHAVDPVVEDWPEMAIRDHHQRAVVSSTWSIMDPDCRQIGVCRE
jgi:hypothetical protein